MEDKLLAFAFLSPYVFWNMPFDFAKKAAGNFN